jgi:hypothetical protein
VPINSKVGVIVERWLRRPGDLHFPRAEVEEARRATLAARGTPADDQGVQSFIRFGRPVHRGWVLRGGRRSFTKMAATELEAGKYLEALLAGIDGTREAAMDVGSGREVAA